MVEIMPPGAMLETPEMIAEITADVTEGQPPLTVQFYDISTGNPTGWEWSFGDDPVNVTDQNPAYTFQVPGTYTVILTIRDGNQFRTDTITISVYDKVAATMGTPEPAKGIIPGPTASDPTTSTQTPSANAIVSIVTIIATAGALGTFRKTWRK
jgi:PKD repeat protein